MPRKTSPNEYKNYIGDVNLEYGGTFYNLDDYSRGSAYGLRVDDIDGIANLITRIDIMIEERLLAEALECSGIEENEELPPLLIAYAIASYMADTDPYFEPFILTHDKNWICRDNAIMYRCPIILLKHNQDVFTYLRSNGYLKGYK